MTKKTLALALCLALICSLLAGCGGDIKEYDDGSADTAEATAAPDATAEPEATEEPEPTAEPGLGLAAYEPDTVAGVCNGQDITWREEYYWLSYYVEYIRYMTAMGMPFSGWDGMDYSATLTNAQLVAQSARDSMVQMRAMELLAQDVGTGLDETDQQSVQEAFDQSADSYGDQDGTCTPEEAEAYEAYLAEQGVDRALYEYFTGADMLADKVFQTLYGQDGANMSDEDVLAWAEGQGVMACKHILLMTVDQTTGQPLEDDVIAEKKAKADELYAQLAAVEDDPEALPGLFDELMNTYSEDTGLAAFPDGYIFTPGVMVPEFETTTQSLEEYGVAEPVQSSYGYHIIMRLPVDPDGTCTGPSGGAPLRASAADAAFSALLTDAMTRCDTQWTEGMETPDIPAIFGE